MSRRARPEERVEYNVVELRKANDDSIDQVDGKLPGCGARSGTTMSEMWTCKRINLPKAAMLIYFLVAQCGDGALRIRESGN